MSNTELPKELWLTFEDGVHVGVFHHPTKAEKLNELRRKKRGVEPVTARYVLSPVCEHDWKFVSLADHWQCQKCPETCYEKPS